MFFQFYLIEALEVKTKRIYVINTKLFFPTILFLKLFFENNIFLKTSDLTALNFQIWILMMQIIK